MSRLILLLSMLLPLAVRAEPVAFGLFGDMPYNEAERQQLPSLIAEMDTDALAFVINVGDIKSGGSLCSDNVYREWRSLFNAMAHPVIYLPGDNEWTDCHRWNNGSYDPLERLAFLRGVFYPDEMSLGRRRIALERQSRDPAFADYRENVRWQVGQPSAGVLFVGMNLPGSDNNYHGTERGSGPVPEFIERSRANRTWLASSFAMARERKLSGLLLAVQGNPDFEKAAAGKPTRGFREFLEQLREETSRFAGQVVLVHGDTHEFRIDQPLMDAGGKLPLANFLRVETHGSPMLGWVRGRVDPNAKPPFSFESRPYLGR